MKTLLITIFMTACVSIAAQSVQQYAPCPGTLSPIQCGYYQEGWQDGESDARSNRADDYRRYRSKLDSSRYENFYRQGYDAGYAGVSPSRRWTNEQRRTYDNGYRAGDADKRRGISRLPERYEGQYDRTFELFYRQGYIDGYDGRSRQYDTPIGAEPTTPNFPSTGTPTGTVSWRGRVDDRVNIVIQGAQVRADLVSGNPVSRVFQSISGVLPNRSATVAVYKTQGRGSVTVLQQPDRGNGYTAVVQIVDSRSGADDYNVQISWQATAPVEEPYQTGRVTWRGRVDQSAVITIAGGTVLTQDTAGTGVSSVNFDIRGYLARRPGTVAVRKTRGRGTVSVTQQPNADNDFAAVIQIFDAEGGAGDYELEITW